jgi:hypothetical protein
LQATQTSLGIDLQLELKIDLSLFLTRCAFAALILICLATLLPQLALSFGDVNCGVGKYAYDWPHRAFPSAFRRVYGDMLTTHMYSSAFVLAINFWTVFSVTFIYLTRTRRFIIYAMSFSIAVLVIEAAFSLILTATTYSPSLPYFSHCAPVQ